MCYTTTCIQCIHGIPPWSIYPTVTYRIETRTPLTTDKIIHYQEVIAKKSGVVLISRPENDLMLTDGLLNKYRQTPPISDCQILDESLATIPCLGQLQTLIRTDSLEIIYPVQDRGAKNHTLSSGTSPYSPYRGVSPPPRPPLPFKVILFVSYPHSFSPVDRFWVLLQIRMHPRVVHHNVTVTVDFSLFVTL